MHYGLTGNPTKSEIWSPVAQLIDWLSSQGLPFSVHTDLVEGLRARGQADAYPLDARDAVALTERADVLLSFGGDGTLLRVAHATGAHDTPVLGVNIGRLGFLADIEVEQLTKAVAAIEAGNYTVEERMVLEITGGPRTELAREWALNEFVIDRSGAAGLIHIEVEVDGVPLNTYWADGLIMATPTGSTAYSLSSGGPIIAPGVDAIILTPIAPHTLTVRPIVLPGTATITARVQDGDQPYVCATDGRSVLLEEHGLTFTVERAAHTVNLVKLPGQHFFKTLRTKLMWGRRPSDGFS
ncbi:NAD(+)/NADH kinase [Salisaeta longa]|uniref:NAD(+)/NADH kinase n=1 Tax=Salisaeta longa TaxID=503170 RepID=UPI0003B5B0FE|nr:NAD(+)/NADH kinase [Salisaeta longa]